MSRGEFLVLQVACGLHGAREDVPCLENYDDESVERDWVCMARADETIARLTLERDTLAKALEEREADIASMCAAIVVARDALEGMRRMAAKPMKSRDSGSVIDANRVDEDAEDALAAIARVLTGEGGEMTLIEDLEEASRQAHQDSVMCYGADNREAGAWHEARAARLREHAKRLREALDKLEALESSGEITVVHEWLLRELRGFNGGSPTEGTEAGRG